MGYFWLLEVLQRFLLLKIDQNIKHQNDYIVYTCIYTKNIPTIKKGHLFEFKRQWYTNLENICTGNSLYIKTAQFIFLY